MIRSDSPLPPDLRRLVRSNLAAQSAEQLALAIAPLIAVLAWGASASQTAWLQTAQTLPFLLLALPLGILADRASRSRLMYAAELLRALTLALLTFWWVQGGLSLLTLGMLGALGACGTVAYSVAAPALVPTLVGHGQLTQANRQLELTRSLALAGGPMLAGLAFEHAGPGVALALSCLLSVFAAWQLRQLAPEAERQPSCTRGLRQLSEGIGFVSGHIYLRPIVLTAVVFNTAWFVLQGIYVAYAADRLTLSAAHIGLTLGLYGAGMVAGAWAAPAVARRWSFGSLVAWGPTSALCAALLMACSLIWPTLWLVAPAFVLFGAGPILWTIATTSLRQAVTPADMLGRVSSVILTATYGARPLGAALGAIVAARAGVEAALYLCVAGFALQWAILWRSPVRKLDTLPRAR